jgi:hypothetical protein
MNLRNIGIVRARSGGRCEIALDAIPLFTFRRIHGIFTINGRRNIMKGVSMSNTDRMKRWRVLIMKSGVGCPLPPNGASHDLTWPLIPTKCSFNLQMHPPPPPPPLDAFLTILATHFTFNHLNMNPCNIFSFWGHCKFVNANSKAKSKVEFAQCKQLKNAKKEPCLRLKIQLSRWKKNEWKLFNIPLESPPNSSKLEDEL